MARAGTIRRETPQHAADAAELLRSCAQDRAGVRIAGAGTKPWGHPGAACEVRLDTAALDAIVEHNAGDLTAVLQPGVSLRELDATLARADQMLALDPPLGSGDAATVGGAIAAGDSGPLRHRYGAARDLVLGVTVALPDGTLARSGGKVIKNVAGYDIAKLLCGSFGTLGLICEVAVRLHPRPRRQATATGTTDDPARLAAAASALAHGSLELQSLDVRWRSSLGLVLARFGGVAAAQQAAGAQALLAQAGMQATVVEDDDPLWAAQRAAQRSAEGGAVVRVSGRPTQLADACVAAQVAGGSLVGRAALGVSWIALAPAAPGELVTAIARIRKMLAPSPCVVLDAPAHVRTHLDPWDHPEDAALMLMRRVKARFDPHATCNPAIFVGGL
ncbi:MAG: glycolate oxidase binding subunit [Solirubrobacteraceae bacterium]|jgi:glycolate oxidase FAD binding subunit|nr:glycolate oxidase binding subunit [Solirubrobacteraceae bacterium]